MSILSIPDVQSMYQALLPGGELVGEAISILRDSYAFFSRYVDPSEGGRALVLAIFSLVLTVGVMIQRRIGNYRSLLFTSLGVFAVHGSMMTLCGVSWLVFPALEFFLMRENTRGLVILMSLTSIFLGWGQDCVPGSSGYRPRSSGRWRFNNVQDSPWGWASLFFGVLLTCLGLAFYRLVQLGYWIRICRLMMLWILSLVELFVM